MRESDIEDYLVKRVNAFGGETRKVEWVGRAKAPDRVVMLPGFRMARPTASIPSSCVWVELKNPRTIRTFPSNAHERAQYREHERMRELGQLVAVIGTFEQVDAMLEAYA